MLASAGCLTRPPQLVGANERFEGQVSYAAKSRIVAEVLLRRTGPEDAQLLVFKGPGADLLEIRIQNGKAWVHGPLAGPGWTGAPSRAPGSLRPWLLALEDLADDPAIASRTFEDPDGKWSLRFRFKPADQQP